MIIIASAAVTKDGYMDDPSPMRLVISGPEDWREVHELRAECDAILVGAGTLRKDDPSLVIRDEGLRKRREAEGKDADMIKVVVSGSGELDPSLRFFTEGEGRKIVITRTDADHETVEKYSTGCTAAEKDPADTSAVGKYPHTAAERHASEPATKQHPPKVDVIRLPVITTKAIVERLAAKGVEKLMVEGGAETLKMFFDEDMVDRLRLAISPLTLDEMAARTHKDSPTCLHSTHLRPAGSARSTANNAPRLPYFGCLPFEESAVKRVHKADDMEVIDYIIHPKADTRDIELLQRAIDLSRHCRPSMTAYCVGCVVATADGRMFEGYTHETGPHNHAEEEALLKADLAGADLAGATIYTSMEPCSVRRSKPVSCCELILRAGITRVIYAFGEPDRFVRCTSTAVLRDRGVEVVVPEGFSREVIDINRHLIN